MQIKSRLRKPAQPYLSNRKKPTSQKLGKTSTKEGVILALERKRFFHAKAHFGGPTDEPRVNVEKINCFYRFHDFLKFDQRHKKPICYYPSGSIYTFWNKTIEQYGDMYGPKILPLILNDMESVDIDTYYDLVVANGLLKNKI